MKTPVKSRQFPKGPTFYSDDGLAISEQQITAALNRVGELESALIECHRVLHDCRCFISSNDNAHNQIGDLMLKIRNLTLTLEVQGEKNGR